MCIAIARAVAAGACKYSSFSGSIPGISTSFCVGDVFTLPTVYEVFSERINNTCNAFIFVENQFGEIRRLYPSQLSRVVRNVCTGSLVMADGTASQLYRQYATVNDGMNALKGKTLRISNIQKVQTNVGYGETIKTIYTFDLVD